MDLSNIIGTDLQITSGNVIGTADIAISVNPTEGQQRVLRRLLTNPLDYVWQPAYGAGLARFIGRPMNNIQVSGTIRQQMKLEQAVKQLPPPAVSLNTSKTGSLVASIQYVDSTSNLTSALSVPLTDVIAE